MVINPNFDINLLNENFIQEYRVPITLCLRKYFQCVLRFPLRRFVFSQASIKGKSKKIRSFSRTRKN